MKNSNITEEELLNYILQYLSILNNNFIGNNKKIPYKEIYDMMCDLYNMINSYYSLNYKKCGKICIVKYIPLLDLLLKIDGDGVDRINYEKHLKNAYRIAARISFEHYMIYREWDMPQNEKFFEPRYEVMRSYIHYLEQITYNPNFKLLIFNAPSGMGKTYPEKISEAWNFGVDPTGTVLSLCSNDDVVKGGSRSVIDEIKSDKFGEVFPNLKWDENDKNFFLKETDSNWKLKKCKLPASYYARTVQANVVGLRASQRIHIDDLYADYKEAMDQSLNSYYFNKYISGWRQRFIQNKIPKIVVTGTLWSSGDFISLLINNIKETNDMKDSDKFKYTQTNEDETIVIIQVPALDYETGKSTCPELKTTAEIEQEKASIDEYLFQTNFQQIPTDPETLFFSYNKLKTYKTLPIIEDYASYGAIDATRKSGKDFFAMPILKKKVEDNLTMYYLTDCIFTREATKDMYDEVIDKIIKNHIVKLVVESNVTSELKKALDERLTAKGITYCEIIEKYNSEVKATRIENEKSNIVRRIVYPDRNIYGVNTDIGRFMNNLTLYNGAGRNKNDDAPDSLGLFSHEIIEDNIILNEITIFRRPF